MADKLIVPQSQQVALARRSLCPIIQNTSHVEDWSLSQPLTPRVHFPVLQRVSSASFCRIFSEPMTVLSRYAREREGERERE